ncbi:hypothetical protein BUALT_Bualt09G0129000 [Buddleja alternifolia]|uniref:Nodulation signaling pathway 2-like protein n=1 Tax=Buddleja alternifolia TaxID=168488 RepID=A0AAV6X9J3_9LAMI|nr:hypothetical protein BUALT_Bualt09G0129000 [Buddleja alternifolia]
MMQPEIFLPSWPTFNFSIPALDHNTINDQEMEFHSFASPDDSSVISSNSSYVPNMFPDEFLDLENLCDQTQITSSMEGLENFSSGEIEYLYECLHGNNINMVENSSSPLTLDGDELSPCFSIESSTDMSLILPRDETEIEKQLILLHLLRAYAEAMENGEMELADMIVKSINEKSNPLGNTMERVAYNLFQSREEQGEYLRQESSKNHAAAYKVIYQSLPNGRFAHLTAISAILESMPENAEEIRVVDFDMGEGIQWPPLIEALSRKQKALRLTSIKSGEECTSYCWSFAETKRRLLAHARQYGVRLEIEEKYIEDLENELLEMKKRGQGKEWMVFNCMAGLPHMGRRRPRSSVMRFLKVAKELLANFAGIVTFGDGEAWENLNTFCSYSSTFDQLIRHYQALFESLERNFPVYLAEARMAMESLFLAPIMCPVAWSRDWEEMIRCYSIEGETGLEGRKLSEESLAEAKQMVNESENSYKVRIERLREHEMVLQWKETTLVRVSTWM